MIIFNLTIIQYTIEYDHTHSIVLPKQRHAVPISVYKSKYVVGLHTLNHECVYSIFAPTKGGHLWNIKKTNK